MTLSKACAPVAYLLFASTLAHSALAQTAQDLVGAWMLVSNVNTNASGVKTDVYGANPKGIQIFESSGRFAVVTTRADLPLFASKSRLTGTPEENKAIVQGSNAFYGAYLVRDNAVIHKIEGGTWPAWNGTEEKREIVSYTGDEMKWKISGSVGGTSEVIWRRMK